MTSNEKIKFSFVFFFTFLAIIMAGVLLTGCSAKVVVAPEVKEDTEVVSFVRLVTYLRSDAALTPTKEMVDTANFLVFESGFIKECVNSKCYLRHHRTNAKVIIQKEYIEVEMPNKQFYKIEDTSAAVRVIYS